MSVAVKRAYDEVSSADGMRVLVDRLWPRGISKDDARIDVWLTALAPSHDLRTSWHSTEGWHEGAGFEAFCEAYRDELNASEHAEALSTLRALIKEHSRVTLVTASKDPAISHVAVILEAVYRD